MSILGQNVLTETVEYLDAGSIFDAVITRKIAALNTSTESNVDLFIGATGKLNFNVKGYNAFRFQQKSDSDKTIQMDFINNQGLEIIAGDNERTTTISDITYTQSVSKHNVKSSKGIVTFDDDIEITGSLTTGQDFLVNGAVISSSFNVMRTDSSNTVGYGFRIDNNSNLELYKFDDVTNITKKILHFGAGNIEGTQDTDGFPRYGSNIIYNPSGIDYAAHNIDTFWSSNGTDIYFVEGRIGIGTDTPLYSGHFQGTVFASNGFRDGTTIIENGVINAKNIIASTVSTNDGSDIKNITAANITIGKLQNAVMPNIITTNELNSDIINSIDLHINNDIFFNGNIYRNGELFADGDTGLFGYYASNDSIYYSAGGFGIGLSNPKLSLDIKGTDAIKVPVGESYQRPSSNIGNGMLRYNTTTSQFEGYGNNNWGSLGGLIDVNQDTYISAETSPGANNDELIFYTSNNQRMIINKTGNIGINTSTPTNTLHVIGDGQFTTNLTIGGKTTMNSSLTFNTTEAIKLPLGTTAQRPIASTGMLRYNTTTTQFEGYGSNAWAGLGGVIDVNQDTYISAETSPGINNDQLKFYTSNVQRMTINSNGDVSITSNLLTSNITTSNLIVTNKVSSHLIPASNEYYDLGGPSNKWRDLYLSGNSFYLGDTLLERDATSGNITFTDKTDSNIKRSIIVDQIQLSSGTTNSNSKVVTLSVNSSGDLNVVNNTTGTTADVWNTAIDSNLYYKKGSVLIGTTSNSENYSLLVNSNIGLTGNIYQNDILFSPGIFTKTSSNIYYNGHTISQASNYTAINSSTGSTLVTVMGITAKFLDLTTITLPSNVPISRENNYVFKATKAITLNLSGSIDGSTAYVSTGPSNAPLATYYKGANSNQEIGLSKNQYLAVLGF